MSRTTWKSALLLTALVSAMGCVADGHRQGGEGQELIVGVDMAKLALRLNLSLPVLEVGQAYVAYTALKGYEGACRSMGIGVHRDVPSAQEAFELYVAQTEIGPLISVNGDDGYYLRCWCRPEKDDCSVLLRVLNVTANFYWVGSVQDGLDFAKKLANVLATSQDIAPRGDVVLLPSVEIALPEFVVAGKKAELGLKVLQGSRVRLAERTCYRTGADRKPQFISVTGSEPGLFAQGAASVDFPEPGSYELELRFATEGNVIFTKTCQVKVISES